MEICYIKYTSLYLSQVGNQPNIARSTRFNSDSGVVRSVSGISLLGLLLISLVSLLLLGLFIIA
jgi:hypothetical protein